MTETNDDLASPSARFDARLKGRASAATLQRKLIDQERATLDATLAALEDSRALPGAASVVVAARRRFVIGKGKSFAFAALLAHDMGEGLSNVVLVDDTVFRDVDLLSDVRSSDILIVFSFRRYRAQTITVAREFARRGGQVLAITDRPTAPVAELSHAAIVVGTESASSADSPTALAAVCHILSTLVTASAKGAQRRLSERDDAFAALGLYAPDPHQRADDTSTVDAGAEALANARGV